MTPSLLMMVVTSILAYKDLSISTSHILHSTATKRSHHVEKKKLSVGIYKIIPKHPVSIRAVVMFILYGMTLLA